MAPRARRPGPELAGGAPGLGPEPSGKGGEGARGPGGPAPGRPAPRASSADGEPDLLAPRGHRTPGWPFRRAGGQLPGSESSHRHRPPSGAPAPPTAPDRRTLLWTTPGRPLQCLRNCAFRASSRSRLRASRNYTSQRGPRLSLCHYNSQPAPRPRRIALTPDLGPQTTTLPRRHRGLRWDQCNISLPLQLPESPAATPTSAADYTSQSPQRPSARKNPSRGSSDGSVMAAGLLPPLWATLMALLT
nr:serine/arginine repetitive matrix protein 3 [Oryctolagus cuniculus]